MRKLIPELLNSIDNVKLYLKFNYLENKKNLSKNVIVFRMNLRD